MSEVRPRLEVVEGGAASVEPAQAASHVPLSLVRRVGTLAWVLAGLLALALVGVGHESRRADQLAAELMGLHAQLATSQAALEAHEEHLGAVRGAVARLQTLVSQEPTAPAPLASPQPR